jgi:hypothetical protein
MSNRRVALIHGVIIWVAFALLVCLVGMMGIRLWEAHEENVRHTRALSTLRQIVIETAAYQAPGNDFFPALEPEESGHPSVPDSPQKQDAPAE